MRTEVCGQPVYLYRGRSVGLDDTGRQPTIVFLHGAQQDHSCWLLQARWFAHHGFRVLAPDLPGHGRSGGEALPSIEALADWVATLLAGLEISQAHVLGHSMGSLIALEFAARYPQRVLRTVLIGSSLPMPVAPLLLDAARGDEEGAATMINAWSYSAASQLGGSALPGLWLLGVNRCLMARQQTGVLHTDLVACNTYARSLDSLAALATPVMVMAGRQDRMTPLRLAKDLAAAIPAARLVVIEDCGHAMMAERPDAVLDALCDFLVT